MGFIARDVIYKEGVPPLSCTGGSCGNVLALLAWLGWRAVPIARLGDDIPGTFVRNEMERLGVVWDHVRMTAPAGTPTIIQEFVTGPEGRTVHRFRVACPTCRGFLPRYTAPTIRMAREAFEKLGDSPDVFYFDRASPAAIEAAMAIRTDGALTVFEPSGAGDPKLFLRAVGVSDIVKYSSDHRHKLAGALAKAHPRVEIETLGPCGLRFRTRIGSGLSAWSVLPAYSPARFEDAAGAGDCCTAGLIWSLNISRREDAWTLTQPNLRAALRFGQALASINCAFVGARGLMRVLTGKKAIDAARRLVDSKGQPRLPADAVPHDEPNELAACHACAVLL